jgi:TRAP-type C4-dicarboxylate transport system permease small subunit
MKNVVSILDKIYNRCIDYLFYVSQALIGILMLVIVADVTLRYTIKGAILWGFEFTEYSLIYLTFLGTAWLLRGNHHVRMDVLMSVLKPIPLAYLNFIASILLIITCVMLVWFGTALTVDNIQSSTMSVKYYSIPKFILTIIIPISSFLLLIQALKQASGKFSCLKQS